MIYLKNEQQIECIRKANQIVAKTLNFLKKYVKAGVSTKELDELAEKFIISCNAIPSFKGFEGFPASICTSVNEVVVHGIPSSKEILKEGDIISIDCGVIFEGWQGDAARTFAVGKISEEKQRLIDVTKQSFFEGISELVVGSRIGGIGYRVQKYVESNGFSVVRELVGHGIGREMHEDPEVPNYGSEKNGIKIENGLVIAIEPMVNYKERFVVMRPDGWKIETKDGYPSAHYENTIAIFNDKIEILSLLENEDE